MNKKLLIGAAVGCVAVAAIASAKNRSAGTRPSMAEKMRERMEQMPEDFPPRVMFDNVQAARANSERILELLEEQRGSSDEGAPTDGIEIVQTT